MKDEAGIACHVGFGSFCVVLIIESFGIIVDSHSSFSLVNDKSPQGISCVIGIKC